MQHQLPRLRELVPLLTFKKTVLSPRWHRLKAALTTKDLRRITKARTPRPALDFTDGAADGEVSLAQARQAFQDVQFNPHILRDVARVDTSCDVLGGRMSLPFGNAPSSFTRILHTEGEIAGATAVGAAGITFPLSTIGTTSIERVVATGSSPTCGGTASDRWCWSLGQRRRTTTHCWSPLTFRLPGRGCVTFETE